MANVKGLGGYNKTDGTAVLIAAYGNDLVNVDTGAGYKQNLTSTNNAEFFTFLNNLFFQNYADRPRHFNGSIWRKNLANKMPMAKFMQDLGNQFYLGYVKFPQTGVESWDKDPINTGVSVDEITFPSRVFFCNVPKNRTELKWGVLWSQKFKTIKDNDNKLFLTQPLLDVGFLDAGVKFGDPVYILDGSSESVGQYTVKSVDSNSQLTLLQSVPKQLTNASGWVGSNWFDVSTDDGDFLTGLGKNNNQLLCFKNNSLHRYNKNQLVQIKGVPGTTSGRSIQNVKDTATIYFHGSAGDKTGFYLTDGITAKKISNALEKHIQGISSSMYSQVVAWTEGDLYRAYVGDITNTNHDISVAKAVWTFDPSTNTQTIDPIGKVIKSSTKLRESNALNTYVGDDSDSVFKMGQDTVYSYDTSPIPFAVETHPIYPTGSFNLNDFTRVQVIARNARGIKVEFKLYDMPEGVDQNWQGLGEIKNDKTELQFPIEHRKASGIAFRFSSIESVEPDLLIEQLNIFYGLEGTEYVLSR